MNEELMIKLKVDTSAITPAINKLKNEVSNVNKTISTMGSSSSATSKTTAEANKGTNKLSQAIGKLTSGMQKLKGINFGNLVTTVGATTVATTRLENAVKKLQNTTKKTANPNAGHFTNAFGESFNPNSYLYDEEDFSMDKAWNNFNDEFANGMSAVMGNAKVKLKDLFSAIKSFKMPTSFKEFTSLLGNMGGKVLGPLKGAFSGLQAKIAGAGGGFKGFAKVIAGSSAAIAAAGAALLGFISALAAFTAAGITAAFTVSKLGDEVYHSANKFGFSTKAYQEWSYVMERSGSSIEDLKGFLETLGSEQAAVITGSEDAAKKFENLGISAEEAAGMDSQQLFETTIKKLQGISSATERSAYAYQLFGDEASRLMNVINMSNGEMQEAINQYNLLGGAMSGELVEKSNRLQNSIANMKQAWQGISNTLAEVFIPVVQKVVNWLTKAFVWVNLFLRTIFGLDLTSSAKSTDKAASSTNKYTGGIKAAKKAAEELKRTTMGFDELNIVQDPNKGGSSDSSAGAGGLGGANIPSLDSSLLNMEDLNLDSMYAWFEKYKGLIAQIATWSLILIGILLAVIGIASVNVPLALLGIGLAGLGIAVGFSSGAFEEAWGAMQGVIASVCDAIGISVEVVTAVISKFFEVAWIIIKGVWDLVVPYFELVWAQISGVFSVVVTYLGGMFSTAWTTIKAVWNVVVAYFELVWAGIKAVFAVVKAVLTGDFKGAWDAIKNVWDKVKAYFQSIWDGIKSVFASVVNWFGNTFAAAWNAVTNVFSKVGNFFKGVWNIIKDIFKSIGGTIGEAVSNAFSSAINWVLEKAIGIINGFISAINTAIGVINAIPGVEIKKLSKLSVPKLAEGGIATRSMIANIGEAGKEAVLPLENNTEWMDTLADKIAARNAGPTKIVLQVGEKELGWATIDSINSITKQTGTIQLTL